MNPMLDTKEDREVWEYTTPGPWCLHPNGTSIHTGERYDTDDPNCRVVISRPLNLRMEDLVFILHARERWTLLLDEIERLKALVEEKS